MNGHTFRSQPCALCGRTHRVTSIPKMRGKPKPPQPPTHRIIDPEDVTSLALLRGLIRAYCRWCKSDYEPSESVAHDDAVRDAAAAIGEPFFGMNELASKGAT